MIGYLISSHKGYERPLQRLLMSMPTTRDVVAVVGGHAERSQHQILVRQIYVPHNSYDYTALIDYVEHVDDYPAWSHVFLLHDTMELGPDADALISQADRTRDAVAAWGGECNLALYRTDYLLSRAAEICALKNCTKLQAVEAEGFLWRTLPAERRGSFAGDIGIGPVTTAYDGAQRLRVHYAGVDVTKYKANWGQMWPPSVVTP